VALRVGVVGHRAERLVGVDRDQLRATLEAVLRQVRESAVAATADVRHYRADGPRLTLLTGMAEGTDREAVRAAHAEATWAVHAVLPFPIVGHHADSQEALRASLDGCAGVTVLDGVAGRYDAYVPLANVLVEQADVLVAVWDGERARGVGGTAEVVQHARRESVPIVRIDPLSPTTPWLEDLGAADLGRGAGVDRLPATLAALLAPPTHDPILAQFLTGDFPRRPRSRLYDRLVHFAAGTKPPSGGPMPAQPGQACAAEWRSAWRQLPGERVEEVAARFAEAHGWADTAALWYGAAFRQSFTAIFMLTILAVMAAGIGAAEFESFGPMPEVAEVLLLLVVLFFVRQGRQARSQDRWLQFRSLAERIRHLAMLWPLARTTPLVRVPEASRPTTPPTRDREGWVAWYLRAVARDAGLVGGTLDAEHTAAVRDWFLEAELLPQQRFHDGVASRSAKIHHPLEAWAQRFVVLAVLLAIARLTGTVGFVAADLLGWAAPRILALEEILNPSLHAAAVTLPALAAGIHGFLGTADFEGSVLRSGGIAPQLGRLANRMRWVQPVELLEVGAVASDVSRVMEGELGIWRTGAESRRLQA
jgi:hypothetical protein